MSNDLISRETLLNEFDTKCQRMCPTCEYHKWNSKLKRYECELINTAPTVEQNVRFYYEHGYKQAERDLKRTQSEWQPLSDSIPVGKGYYLTTTVNHEVYCDYWSGDHFDRTEVVIAWMPLPEPYMGKEQS